MVNYVVVNCLFFVNQLTAPDAHGYVNSIANLNNNNGGGGNGNGNGLSDVAPPISGTRSSSQRNDQRDYVNQPISSGGSSSGFHHHHHHHHSSSGGGGGGQQSSSNQQRARRTQKRVTHNEKRYHSGLYENLQPFKSPPLNPLSAPHASVMLLINLCSVILCFYF